MPTLPESPLQMHWPRGFAPQRPQRSHVIAIAEKLSRTTTTTTTTTTTACSFLSASALISSNSSNRQKQKITKKCVALCEKWIDRQGRTLMPQERGSICMHYHWQSSFQAALCRCQPAGVHISKTWNSWNVWQLHLDALGLAVWPMVTTDVWALIPGDAAPFQTLSTVCLMEASCLERDLHWKILLPLKLVKKLKTRLENCSLWLLCRACHISVLGKANVQISSRVKSIPSIHPASYCQLQCQVGVTLRFPVFHACEAGVPPASTRKIISPPCDLAKSQLNKAVRAPPTWSLRKHFAVLFVSFRWRQSL